jgi:hypothetical protein
MYMGTNIITYFYAFEVERLSKKLATFFLHYMDNLLIIDRNKCLCSCDVLRDTELEKSLP